MGSVYSYEQALESSMKYFRGEELPAYIFLKKYALQNEKGELLEDTPEKMFRRIALELERIEKQKFKKPLTYEEIYSYLDGFKKIIPQGSPMSGIGNSYQYVSLSNCFVIEPPLDSYASILKTDEEIVQISKRRGGVGTDISNLRPAGTPTTNAAKTSTGIISFMERYSRTIREVGQCLKEDTLILSEKGLKEIQNIKEGERVWTDNGWVAVLKVIHNMKKCLKITTKYGKEIVCSEEHSFHSIDGEKQARNFKVGDSITQIVGEGWEGEEVLLSYSGYKKSDYNNSNRLEEKYTLPSILDVNLSYLLGYSYGDGYVGFHHINKQKNELSLSCSDDWEKIKHKIKDCIKEVFNYEVKIKKSEGCDNYCIHSRLIIDFLKQNNLLKQKAGSLEFPEKILSAKANILFSFLAGYFDADGSVVESKKVYKISSIDKSFLQIIQNILMSFGIISVIHKTNREGYGWHDIYVLSINGEKSQGLFRGLMLESIKIGSISFDSKIRDFMRTNYTIRDFDSKSSRHSYVIDNEQYLSYSTSDRVIKDLDIKTRVYLLQDYIKVIEEYLGGEEQDVYDLCLENTHLFFANGLYVHNSGRRGALMLTLSVHHPEIKAFVSSKKDLTKITGANISVRLSDEFLKAVKTNTDYELRWPVDSSSPKISNMVNARQVWKLIIENAHFQAEPGLLFWDNILRESPADCYSKFGYKTVSTNPCSELPLCPLDSCRLLLINLYSYVRDPFTKNSYFDFDEFCKDAKVAQRFMDDIVDLEVEMINKIIGKVKKDPEPDEIKNRELELWKKIKDKCETGRRTGTGATALGDTLAALGIKYGSRKGIEISEQIFKALKLACYRSSVDMAKELGAFKIWDYNLEKENVFLNRIKEEDPVLWDDMKKYGRRNIACLTVAPAGTVSIETQTTSGIEPCYAISMKRRKKINANDKDVRVDFIDQVGDSWQQFDVFHPKVKEWTRITGQTDISLSPWFGCCSGEIDWQNRVKLQASINKHIDHAISSTVNLPEDVSVEEVAKIYETAWESGCKGITVYRKNSRTGVLIDDEREILKIKHQDAPKRPVVLPCDIFHISVQGEPFFVLVGILSNEPYEIFAGKDRGEEILKTIKTGLIKKEKRGEYSLCDSTDMNKHIYKDIASHMKDDYEAITRLVSTSLRHGCDVSFVVHQLEKTSGGLMSFSKAISRVLKKYIKEGTKLTGENCPDCGGELKRQEGCVACSCGYSRCG